MVNYLVKQKRNKLIFLLGLCLSLIVLNVSCKKQNNIAPVIEPSTPAIVKHHTIERVEPPNWWVGFKNNTLQLLVKHPNISEAAPYISYQGVAIKKIHSADSPNYLFIDLSIDKNTNPGQFNINFKLKDGKELIHTYELKPRRKSADEYVGFDSSDAIYLITPDRFANGDPSNDINNNLLEQTIDRTNDYARHGGDIAGITKHLDYIESMGFTAIWPCPLLTNDMPNGSYHGYAMTNFYEIDPRFGTLDDYLELSSKMSNKGMKLIMDQVANHCGLEHWWMKDLPFKDWINHQEDYEANKDHWDNKFTVHSNHKRTSNQDIYASKKDKQGMTDGWFVSSMPDLNQRNPYMATYIIQNSIWWIETAKLAGIRQDTYPYPDKDFMSAWAGAIMNEYPNFSIVGEEWSTNPLLIAYWQEGHKNLDGYDSNLKSPMDFAMQSLIVQGLNEEESWGTGLIKLYEGLANDFSYSSPKDLMVFPDNHDMSRIFTQLKSDVTNTKMALSYLLTLPRIPQIYYGTEILMNDSAKPGDHGLIRTDFPGGWDGDLVNAFAGTGLTDTQKDMQNFLKNILHYRKHSKAIHEGKTIHFAPEHNVYVLFRMLNDEIIVHIMNKNNAPFDLDLSRFKEIGLHGKTLKNIISDKNLIWEDTLTLSKKGSTLLTTKF
ncbi:glycoside hydrolase family 13 protein [Snuella sedimenti]|uniref:Cyclomaltodextrinase N-terminal domain-containing protein n=1 Tax=Snuella sedimenti TaxID=2798802 RepID=A0A8J7JBW6_9FLAO|nr:glycoside hydrolase family 13 protein [Snuella sedimenti]MBJ6368269.1 cyclomaltodextrinase N-terminal domain-containing protein [Snuella sedimenti]